MGQLENIKRELLEKSNNVFYLDSKFLKMYSIQQDEVSFGQGKNG